MGVAQLPEAPLPTGEGLGRGFGRSTICSFPACGISLPCDNSGYVLLLQRREPGDAICASATLAGYDRSVAAYRCTLDLAGDAAAAVKQVQLAWLQSRDACGANAECLGQAMRERVELLMQQ